MTRKQHYMTRDERLKLEALRRAGVSVAEIARLLGFCRQTIYNELRRGAYQHNVDYAYETRYSADKGQQLHDYMQTGKGRPLKIGADRAYANFLEKMMLGMQPDGKIDKRKRFSPAAALAQAKKEGYQLTVCVTTLYSYIDKGVFLHLTNKHLWEKSKRKKQRKGSVQRIAHPTLPNISDRPEHINQREEAGHWEMDLIVGKAQTRPVLLTLHERRSRKELIFKLPNRKAATIRAVFDRLERRLGKAQFRNTFKSITTDNGSEFLEYDLLKKSIYSGDRFQVFYCHPYSAWEKGGNENHNRMIRRWYPKGTDFTRVTKKQIADLQNWMNDYPRKVLDWKAPNDMQM